MGFWRGCLTVGVSQKRITMNATDAVSLAKDAVRIVSTAGLSKDVIDLLEKKLVLLTDELATTKSEIADLKTENADLKKKLDALEPKDGLDVYAFKILKHMFDLADSISKEGISAHFSMQLGVVQYHFDELLSRKFIKQASIGIRTSLMACLTCDVRRTGLAHVVCPAFKSGGFRHRRRASLRCSGACLSAFASERYGCFIFTFHCRVMLWVPWREYLPCGNHHGSETVLTVPEQIVLGHAVTAFKFSGIFEHRIDL